MAKELAVTTPAQQKRINRATNIVLGKTELRPAGIPWKTRGGGGSTCTEKLLLTVFGSPTGGDLVMSVRVDGGTPADVTITMPATTSDIVTAFEAHADIPTSSCTVTSAGSGLPSQEVEIEFSGGILVEIMSQTDTALEGGWAPYSLVRRCCG